MERLNTSPEIPAETTHEQSPYPKNLYHVSSWNELSGKNVGDTFLLKPGSQKTEGLGVYFSENAPRPHAAASLTSTHKDCGRKDSSTPGAEHRACSTS